MDEYLYLAHHGILGQKWGKENGPPYPLLPSRKSYAEKRREKKDVKWAKKNQEKITRKAYKKSSSELNRYANDLSKQQGFTNKSGKLSAATINAYNQKMAELMNKQVSEIQSPSGKAVKFVAKRGELGVFMALADQGYNIEQLKNGIYSSGRVAYKKDTVTQV